MSIVTVSLETAKLLKEEGFKQNSYFAWTNTEESNEWIIDRLFSASNYVIAAPTVCELLAELPDAIKSDNKVYGLRIEKQLINVYTVWYYREEEHNEIGLGEQFFHNAFLPEALAACWLYIKNEGLL